MTLLEKVSPKVLYMVLLGKGLFFLVFSLVVWFGDGILFAYGAAYW